MSCPAFESIPTPGGMKGKNPARAPSADRCSAALIPKCSIRKRVPETAHAGHEPVCIIKVLTVSRGVQHPSRAEECRPYVARDYDPQPPVHPRADANFHWSLG